MTVGGFLYSRLKDQTTAGSRIYPLHLPQDSTYPAISYQQISTIRTHRFGQDGSVIRVRVQLNCWGKTYADVQTLAGEVESRLSRFRGTEAGVEVLDVLQDSVTEGYESATQTRRVIQEYTIFVRE